MGLTCCAGSPDPEPGSKPMQPNNAYSEARILGIAKTLTPSQLWMIVKFQARVRGMLTRNRLKRSPKYNNLFKNHGVGKGSYFNERVEEIKQ